MNLSSCSMSQILCRKHFQVRTPNLIALQVLITCECPRHECKLPNMTVLCNIQPFRASCGVVLRHWSHNSWVTFLYPKNFWVWHSSLPDATYEKFVTPGWFAHLPEKKNHVRDILHALLTFYADMQLTGIWKSVGGLYHDFATSLRSQAS